ILSHTPRPYLFPYTTLFRSDSSEISESVNFCVMEAIKLCRLDTPIIFIEARINLSRFVVTGCAAKTSATVTFPSLNLISLFAFCFNIWLNGSYGFRCCHLKNIWTAPLPPETELSRQMTTSTTSIDIMGLQAAYANLHTDQERDYFMQRY